MRFGNPLLRHPDVVVVGVGRTGTSFTAMVLQLHLGVFMAHDQRMVTTKGEDSSSPVGSYEDTAIIKHTYAQVENHDDDLQDWLIEYDKYFGELKGLVGIKNTGMSLFSRAQWVALDPRLVVRTHRPRGLAVKSMERWRGRETDWGMFYDQREKCMQKNLDKEHCFPVLHIEYGYTLTRVEEVVSFLNPYIDELKGKLKGKK